MRPTTRLYAVIAKNSPLPKNPGQYLVPHNPTGLTGITTHPFPRPTLLHLYNSTLTKLAAFPQHSIYRQSVENLTNHRLSIISKVLPPGFQEWQTTVKEQLSSNPEIADEGRSFKTTSGEVYLLPREEEDHDDREEEWDGDNVVEERGEGPRTLQYRARQARDLGEGRALETSQTPRILVVNEPPLTSAQITDLETQFGAGLIEEVIAVAQAELELVDTMLESKVWEELDEKPLEGQWVYFSRDRNVGTTQSP